MKLLLLSLLFLFSPVLGENAPDFTLPDVNGDSVSLHDYHGRIMVVDFWVMWCETCREEVPKIQRIYEKYSPKGVVVLGIHLEEKDAGKVRSFIKNAGITYSVLLDPEETTADRFAIKGTPSLVIIDHAGGIVKKYRALDRKTEKKVHRLLDSLILVQPAVSSDSAGADQPDDVPVQSFDK
jgi:peroxiredoxin